MVIQFVCAVAAHHKPLKPAFDAFHKHSTFVCSCSAFIIWQFMNNSIKNQRIHRMFNFHSSCGAHFSTKVSFSHKFLEKYCFFCRYMLIF
jgi:hypothetical protein